MNSFIIEKNKNLDSIVKKVFENIAKYSQAKNIALRIRNTEGDFPFFKFVGYNSDFIKRENSLLCSEDGPCQKEGPLQCLCGAVLSQAPLLQTTYLGTSGAFITNNFHSTFNMIAPLLKYPRLSCFNEFFISLAFFPLIHNGFPLALFMITHTKNLNFNLQTETYVLKQLSPLKDYLIENSRISLPVEKKAISIMLVDDDSVINDLMGRALSMMGFHVTLVDRAQKALDFLHDNNPDLAIIDLGMPDISGMELIKMIRANTEWNDLKIMIFSGMTDRLDEAFFEKHNISYVLKKPVMNIMNLDKVIDGIINDTI